MKIIKQSFWYAGCRWLWCFWAALSWRCCLSWYRVHWRPRCWELRKRRRMLRFCAMFSWSFRLRLSACRFSVRSADFIRAWRIWSPMRFLRFWNSWPELFPCWRWVLFLFTFWIWTIFLRFIWRSYRLRWPLSPLSPIIWFMTVSIISRLRIWPGIRQLGRKRSVSCFKSCCCSVCRIWSPLYWATVWTLWITTFSSILRHQPEAAMRMPSSR